MTDTPTPQSPKATPDNGAVRDALRECRDAIFGSLQPHISISLEEIKQVLSKADKALSHPVKADHVPDTGKMVVPEHVMRMVDAILCYPEAYQDDHPYDYAELLAKWVKSIASQHTTTDGKGV